MFLPKVLRHLEHKADGRESSVLIEIIDDDSTEAHLPDARGRGRSEVGGGAEDTSHQDTLLKRSTEKYRSKETVGYHNMGHLNLGTKTPSKALNAIKRHGEPRQAVFLRSEGEEGLLDGDPGEEEVAKPAGGRPSHQR